MILNDLSDQDLVIINNTMGDFFHELRGTNFQSLFSHDKEFLENILYIVNTPSALGKGVARVETAIEKSALAKGVARVDEYLLKA